MYCDSSDYSDGSDDSDGSDGDLNTSGCADCGSITYVNDYPHLFRITCELKDEFDEPGRCCECFAKWEESDDGAAYVKRLAEIEEV